MTRLMYDSVTARAIPANAVMVAGYIDGRYTWTPADWARFPAAVKVRIAVRSSTNGGHVLDCETGDATPAQCPGWVVMRRQQAVDPSVYCNFAMWPAVRAAFAAARVPEPHYWVAGYSKPVDPTIPAGAVARQFSDVGPYDLSTVADYWPGVDPPPAPVVVVPAQVAPPVVVSTATDKELGTVQKTLIMVPVANGCGDVHTAIPFGSVVSWMKQGSDPEVDHVYWSGSVQGQERDGNLLVTVTDARTGFPEGLALLNGQAGVFITTVS